MKMQVVAYFVTALVFLGIDSIWLTMMGNIVYRPVLGDMMLESFRPLPAVAFYLIYIAGLVIFAVAPAFVTGKWITAFTYGAMFGFFAYATYDLTNQATLKRWTTTLSIIDMSWGTILSGVSAALSFLIVTAIFKWLEG